MSNLIKLLRRLILLRGLIFLVIGGLMGCCPAWFGAVQENVSSGRSAELLSQATREPFLLKSFILEDGFPVDSLYSLLDSNHIMVIQRARGATFIDLKNEKMLHSYPLEEETSSEQIFHQDEYLLLQGRGATDIWEIASGKLLQSWRDPDINAKATAVSHSGKTIFTGQYLRQLQDETQPWGKGAFRTGFSARTHAILSAAAISPNENFLATGGTWDNRVILWDIRSGKDVTSWRMEQHVKMLSFSANKQSLYAGTYVKLVAYDLATKAKVFEIPHGFSMFGAEHLEKRHALLMVSDDGEIQLGADATGEILWRYQVGQRVEEWNHFPQGEDLALRLSNGEIVILDLTRGQVRLRFQPPFKVIGPLNVSQDGKRLVVSRYSEQKEKWEVVLWQLPEKGNLGE